MNAGAPRNAILEQLTQTACHVAEAREAGVPPTDAAKAMRTVRHNADAEAIALFMGTLDGQTLNEAMANVELDARAYGWSRTTVRKLASKVRLHFAGRR